MLNPNVMSTSDSMSDVYNNMLKMNSYAYTCNNIKIAKLSPDPVYMQSIRDRISFLSQACVDLLNAKPELWGNVLLPFTNYMTAFEGFTSVVSSLTTNDQWLQLLNQLKMALIDAENRTSLVIGEYETYVQKIMNVQPLLNDSIETAWEELAAEEQQMINIAQELQKLQDAVQEMQSNFTGAELRGGQSYIQSSVTITYGLMSAGASVPFLSLGALAFTIGKSFYDIYSTNIEIAKTLHQIEEYQNEATQTAQALAATKMIMRTLYNLEIEFASIQNNLPILTKMWSDEKDKIQTAINALQAGAKPSIYFDLQTMPTALATWKQLAGYSLKMAQGLEQGQSININILNPNI